MFIVFFQAEDGIRDIGVTGVQTCALPIFLGKHGGGLFRKHGGGCSGSCYGSCHGYAYGSCSGYTCFGSTSYGSSWGPPIGKIGKASCRGRGEISGGARIFKKKK